MVIYFQLYNLKQLIFEIYLYLGMKIFSYFRQRYTYILKNLIENNKLENI